MKLHNDNNDASIFENFSDMIFGTLIVFIVFVLVIVVKTKNWKPVEKTVEVVKIVEKPVEVVKVVEKEVIKEIVKPIEVIKYVEKPIEVVKIVEKPIEVIKYIEKPVEEKKEIVASIRKTFSKCHVSIEKQDGIIYVNTGSVKFTPNAFKEIMKYVEGGLTYSVDNYVKGNDGKIVENIVVSMQKKTEKNAVLSYKIVDKKIVIGRMIMSVDDKNKLISDFNLGEKKL